MPADIRTARVAAAHRLVDRIEAAAQAGEYCLTESLTAELATLLSGSDLTFQSIKSISIRLQQIIIAAKFQRSTLSRSYQRLEVRGIYTAGNEMSKPLFSLQA